MNRSQLWVLLLLSIKGGSEETAFHIRAPVCTSKWPPSFSPQELYALRLSLLSLHNKKGSAHDVYDYLGLHTHWVKYGQWRSDPNFWENGTKRWGIEGKEQGGEIKKTKAKYRTRRFCISWWLIPSKFIEEYSILYTVRKGIMGQGQQRPKSNSIGKHTIPQTQLP